MNAKRSGWIDRDELVRQVSIEQVAAFYGTPLPEMVNVGQECRSKCFLNCGQAHETGDRAIAIKEGDENKRWKCHHYGCQMGGDLISMCDLLKPGAHMDGRPKGDRFKDILRDLQQIVHGHDPIEPASQRERDSSSGPEQPSTNAPLEDSDDERVRALVDLHEQLVVDIEAMNPKAATYLRRRPYLTPDVCRRWKMGYMPSSSKSSLRGKIVYPVHDDAGRVLTWFSRDPAYEEKRQKWERCGREGREPVKTQFVKGFHRGQELFAQHELSVERNQEKLSLIGGLIVVEGPNDVIRLSTLDVPSVGLLSNAMTGAQREKIVDWVRKYTGGRVVLMLDNDAEGEAGAKAILWELAQRCRVDLAWSRSMFDEKFADRQPESVGDDEWQMILERLQA